MSNIATKKELASTATDEPPDEIWDPKEILQAHEDAKAGRLKTIRLEDLEAELALYD
jgi:hypothetical protein